MTLTQINRWKRIQTKIGATPDGDPRNETLDRLEKVLDLGPYAAPAPAPLPRTHGSLSLAALALILRFEVGGGKAYYDKFLARPTYPGHQSGPTIGIGYDLGYESAGVAPFAKHLSASQLIRLSKGLGLRGARASAFCKGVSDIKIPWDAAMEVFENHTLGKEIALTKRTWPGSDLLHPDAFGALVSVIFNRGSQLGEEPRRKEMAQIKQILLTSDPRKARTHELVAQQVASMARLWKDNPNSKNDLHDRRKAEAGLILQAASTLTA